jgi:hypothetical protein
MAEERDFFEEYKGLLELDIEGKKLKVKPTNEQKLLIQKYSRDSQKENHTDAFDNLHKTYFAILKKSYPNHEDEKLQNFLLTKEDIFAEQLSIAFGWMTADDVKNIKEELKKKSLQKVNDLQKSSLG